MVYVPSGCFAHPNCRAFSLGGGSEGRSVGDSVGEGREGEREWFMCPPGVLRIQIPELSG
jgi:hypothetical protein